MGRKTKYKNIIGKTVIKKFKRNMRSMSINNKKSSELSGVFARYRIEMLSQPALSDSLI